MGVEDEIAEALIPAGISPELKWRLAMSLSVAAIFLWIAWAMGFMFGLPGLAKGEETKNLSAQVGEVRSSISEVRASLIAKDIDGVSTTLCMGFNSDLYNYRTALQKQHHDLTGHDHESPPCEVLLALKR